MTDIRKIKINMIVACLIFTVLKSMTTNAVDVDIEFFAGNHYEYIETPMSWSDAEDFAEQKGGHIAIINSYQENYFVKNISLSANTSAADGGGSTYVWLGATDEENEGEWKWVDNSSVEPRRFTNRTMWGSGLAFNEGESEPDNFNNNQHCMALSQGNWPLNATRAEAFGLSGQWNDINCDNKLAFVIEYEAASKLDGTKFVIPNLFYEDKSYLAEFEATSCETLCFKLTNAEPSSRNVSINAPRVSGSSIVVPYFEFNSEAYKLNFDVDLTDVPIIKLSKYEVIPSASFVPSETWEISTPAEMGFDEEKFQEAVAWVFSEDVTQSLVVIKNGVLVYEQYAADYNEQSLATSWSAGKSFTSLALGLAIDAGYVGSVDGSAAEFITEWLESDREAIKIRDILQMSTNLATQNLDELRISSTGSREPETGQKEGFWLYGASIDADGKIVRPDIDEVSINRELARPYDAKDRVFDYKNSETQLIKVITERATGDDFESYINKNLFNKIGIPDVELWKDAHDNYYAMCCYDMTPRQFARLGLLMSREGKWGNDQIISPEWAVSSIEDNVQHTAEFAKFNDIYYGYQWWVRDDWFYALGLFGQLIAIHPGADLIVVRNSVTDIILNSGEKVRDAANFHTIRNYSNPGYMGDLFTNFLEALN